MSVCPECKHSIPMPDLMCKCPESVCVECHNTLLHPGAPCPDCPGSRGYFILRRDPHGYPITAICATCDGKGRIQ